MQYKRSIMKVKNSHCLTRMDIVDIDEDTGYSESMPEEERESLRIAAHDIRSPLTMILGAATSLQEHIAGSGKELVQTIIHSAENALYLLSSILDIDRIEHSMVSIERQRQNLLPVLERSLESYSIVALEKSIEIGYEKDIDYVPVLIDPVRIEQVFNNLLSNAIKYSHPNTKITVSIYVLDGHVQVSVRDRGIGIRQDEMDKLFTKFAKLSNEPTAGEQSTGLGLAIVKKLVELHDGQVDVSSVYREGSTFVVTLPISKDIPEVDQLEEVYDITPSEDTEPVDVLLIDDSRGSRQLLATILRNLGLDVVGEAADGQEGLALYEQLRPDIVFLDIVMPVMSGTEVLRRIREIDPEARVVVMTSIASRNTVLETKQAGAFAYLLKTFDAQKIGQVVNEIKQNIILEGVNPT